MGEIKPARLLNPLNDLVFKALFGREDKQSKLILMDFLNSVLALKDKEKITSITYLNPFNLAEFQKDKSSILDIKVKTQEEKRINIEIQINNEDDFRKRSLYYWAKLYAETINKGEAYHNLKKSIVINIMDFNLIDETDKYHTEYLILEKEDYFPLTDNLSIHYLELPKFKPQEDLLNMEAVELWLSFLKWAGNPQNRQKLRDLIERSELLKMAKEMLEQISADEALQQEFLAREKARLDAISKIKYAEAKGMEKGMAKGMAKGKLDVAKNMIRLGMPIEQVADLVDLPETELKRLVQELDK